MFYYSLVFVSFTRKVIRKYKELLVKTSYLEVEVQILCDPLPYDDSDVADPQYQLLNQVDQRGAVVSVQLQGAAVKDSGAGAAFSVPALLSVRFLRRAVPRRSTRRTNPGRLSSKINA